MTDTLDATTVALLEDPAVELTLAYTAELDRLADLVGFGTRSAFEQLPDYNRADTERFVQDVEPMIRAGAVDAADLAGVYLRELHGAPRITYRHSELPLPTPEALEGPFRRMWHDLSVQEPWAHARDSGSTVAEFLGRDAVSDGASYRMGRPGVRVAGWRRVLQPGACEWCQVVSTKLYRSEETARLGNKHDGCRCRPVIVTSTADPALAINERRLQELRASGAVQRATDAAARARVRRRAARG